MPLPLVLLFLLAMLPTPGHAQQSPYDDDRLVRWSQEYLAGRRDAVLRDVETDLLSAEPHPFAAHVWTMVHHHAGGLEAAWSDVGDPALRAALEPMPDVALLYYGERPVEALRRFPPAGASEIRDPWALTYLAWMGADVGREAESLAYLEHAATLVPDDFQSAWVMIERTMWPEARRRVVALAEAEAFAGTTLQRFLRHRLRFRPDDTQESLAAVDAWLRDLPTDARALRHRALLLTSLEHHGQAVDAYQAAYERYPFIHFYSDLAEAIIRTGDRDEARARTRAEVGRTGLPADEAAALVEQRMARALRGAGERGAAREVLEAALERWPDHGGLREEMAALELASDRPRHAIEHARRATAAAPDDLDRQLQLLEALRLGGDPVGAWEHFQDLFGRVENRTEAFYDAGSDILTAQQRYDEALSLLDRGLDEMPSSAWLMRIRASRLQDMGRTREAADAVRASFAHYQPYNWSAGRIAAWLRQVDRDTAVATLAELRREWPWSEEIWEESAALLSGDAEKLALWREARAANPDRYWPRGRIRELHTDARRWDEAAEVAREGLSVAEARGPAGDVTAALFDLAIITVLRARVERLPEQRIDEALATFDRYRELGGRLGAFHEYRAELLEAAGRYREAADAWLQAAAARPDSERYVRALFRDQISPYTGRRFHVVDRYLRRQPYDGDRLYDAAELHLRWGGSPIRAWQIMQLMKARDPDRYQRSQWVESQALGSLGGHQQDFVNRYANAASVSPSLRYVGWFESARRAAQEASVHVEVDAGTGTATIIHPDGQIERRRDHPISGKPVYTSVDAAWVELSYDDVGANLTAVRASSGVSITLDYNPRGDITELVHEEGDSVLGRLTFEYAGPCDKVSRIAVDGLGEMAVAYDDDCEIAGVDSPAGALTATRVQQAMSELLGLVRPFERRGSGGPPELPYRDEALDSLRSRHDAAADELRWAPGDAELRRAEADAATELLRYLVEHVRDRASYADEAFALAERLYDDATRHPSLRSAGLDAIALWHRLAREVRERGLGAEDWLRWSEMLAWADEQAGSEALLAAVETDPLDRLEGAQWLPRSYLTNPGFWRRYPYGEVVPTGLAAPTDARAVLVRSNGHVVIGSARGLSVLRRGYWEWFGYQETQGGFDAAMALGDTRASSDIRALAEDAAGNLWIGTANGLIRLTADQDYHEPARRWVGEIDGLPAPHVGHLAPYGTGVAVGTDAGMVTFTEAGPGPAAPPALAGAGIRLLAGGEGGAPLRFAAPTGRTDLGAVSPDGRFVAAVGAGAGVVLNAGSGSPVAAFDLAAAPSALAFSGDGSRLLAAGSRGTAVVLDVATGEALHELRVVEEIGAYELVVDRAGDEARYTGVLATDDATLSDGRPARRHTFEAEAGETLEIALSSAAFDTYLILVSPSGEAWTNDDADGSNSFLRVEADASGTWQARVTRYGSGAAPAVEAAAFAPDGRRIATADAAGTLRLWDAATGAAIAAADAHTPTSDGAVSALAYSPDGARLLTAGYDGAARVWDAATLAVRGDLGEDSSLGDYALRIERARDVDTEGARFTDSLTASGDTVSFDLTEEAGTRLTVELTSQAFDTYLTLRSPDGDRFAYNDDAGSTSRSWLDVELPTGGAWVVQVSAYGRGTGPFDLEVRTSRTEATDAEAVQGALRSGETLDGRPAQRHTFEAEAGQRLSVTLESADFDPVLTLVSPSGEAWENDDYMGRDSYLSVTADATGTWEAYAAAYQGTDATPVIAIASAPDGRVATLDDAGAVRLLAPDGRALAETDLAGGGSLAFDASGRLWVGGPDGVRALETDSLTPTATLPLPDGSELLAVVAGDLLAVRHEDGAIGLLDAATGEPRRAAAPLLVGTAAGLYGVSDGEVTELLGAPVQAAHWDGPGRRVFVLQSDQSGLDVLRALEWDGEGRPGPARPVRGQNGIVRSRQTHGLAALPVTRDTSALAVLTDLGVSTYHAYHFEHLDPPQLLADDRAGVHAVDSRGLQSVLLTSEGVYTVERGQAGGDAAGRVYDIVSANPWGLTFIARGDRLDYVPHEGTASEPEVFDRISATHLAVDDAGRLIANDGLHVLRYDVGARSPRRLFEADQTTRPGAGSSAITSILAAGDGSVWATAGASVFRWHEGAVEEFSIFVDDERFPARSDMIASVVELHDGRIWVIASDEGHRTYDGMYLEGGVLEWTGDGFARQEQPSGGGWFITGYTVTGDGEAVVGTGRGFAQHRGSRYAGYQRLGDPSYIALREAHPSLFLGTRGAPLGEDTWLFGSAAGVVALTDGQWFYPDRLNRMLPDQHLSRYGARTVHAVATDPRGRVYAGTDRGLLIYDSGGADDVAFLVSNGAVLQSVGLQEHRKLRDLADRLLASVDPGTEAGRLVQQIVESRELLEELETAADPATALPPTAAAREEGAAPVGLSGEELEALREQLQNRERNHRRLLAELERDHYGLYQLLELKPLDLAALRRELEDDEAVLQYLPLRDRLVIHMVTRDGVELREVDVPAAELQETALFVAGQLRSRAQRLRSGERRPEGAVADANEIREVLAWLYDRLLRPVEHDLSEYRHLYVAPVGALSYVPFAALVRETAPRVRYAVERHAFGYLPSMYLLDLVLRHDRSTALDALVFGDPDGSLPGARAEAGAVTEIMASQIAAQVGADASYETLLRYAGDARVLHLATHGALDEARPEDSWLLLADGYRLSTIDIMGLPLGETDLVMLSACETGLGAEGREYATLARAFGHAGVSSIVATLWQVDDAASRTLVEALYERLQEGDSVFEALAAAQRALIRAGGALANPAAWAGYVPFGKPVVLN